MQAMIADEVKHSTAHHGAPNFAKRGEVKLIDGLQVGYDAAERRLKTTLSKLVGEGIFDTIQLRNMILLLLKSLTPSPNLRSLRTSLRDECPDAFTDHVNSCGCKTPYEKIEKEPYLVHRFQQEFVETTYQSTLATPTKEVGEVNLLTHQRPKRLERSW